MLKIVSLGFLHILLIANVHWGNDLPIHHPDMDHQSSINPGVDWLSHVQEGIAKREYYVSHNRLGLQAPNRANNLRIYFSKNGVEVTDRNTTGSPVLLGLCLSEIGRTQDDLANKKNTGFLDNPKIVCNKNRVEIKRDGITEWYINDASGLEHGFTIPCRPDGKGELCLTMRVHAAEAKLKEESIIFSTPSNRSLKYGHLYVIDANGQKTPAAFNVPDPCTIQILIKDIEAQYPLIIDPLLTAIPDAMVESNQANAYLGYSVSDAGDVNGDGYGDVIVGANYFDNGQNDEGAAFIYPGGPFGISTKPATMMESNNIDSQFGVSVSSAGDVNGDGYDDVIVGAKYYSNGQTSEGAAFVYHGGPGGVPPVATTMMESNQLAANLGYSVSGAGDVNGDGFADVIVAASNYDNGEKNEGAAFVYHGSALGVSSIAAAMLEPNQIAANMDSVSGAGDINGDGFADVVVGARQYSNGEYREGAAFVYYGGPSGISSTGNHMVESNQQEAYLGFSVSGAGDVNGDGYSDIIVGAPELDNGETAEGAAFIYHGGPAGLHTIAATMMESNQTNASLGYSVSHAGDLNGDGYADVIAGANKYTDPEIWEGASFIYHGSSKGVKEIADIIVESNQSYSRMGQSVSGAGDVNGDGYSDIIVGAHQYDNNEANEGAAFVYHGGAAGISSAPAVALEADQTHALLGFNVSDAGDVNNDGYGDVIVGAPTYDYGQVDEGAVFVYHGSAKGVSIVEAAILSSNQANAVLGYCVSGAGDVNNDGYTDIIAGAPNYDNGFTDEGAAFIYYGSATGFNSSAVTIVDSNQNNAMLGWSVSDAGDVNGDGFADVIVGAPNYYNSHTGEGAAFIYHGGPTGVSSTPNSVVDADQTNSFMGYSVSGAGDVNGDGFADVIVGATSYDNGENEEGAAFVYHGGPGGVFAPPISMLESNQTYANMGTGVSSAGDVNGDGFADVIVGAWKFDNGQVDEGAAFVYHGSAAGIPSTPVSVLESDQDFSFMGSGVSCAGDVNGDGFADVIVGAASYDNGEIDEGAAFVYHGSASGVSTVAAGRLESDQDYALMGHSVSGAGDVNGDGFADVIVGASNYDDGQIDEGIAMVFHGNSNGRPVRVNQLRGDSSTIPVPPWGVSHDSDGFQVSMIATHPEGRGRVKLQVEYCGPGVRFGDVSCGVVTSSTWTNTPASNLGVTLTESIPNLAKHTLYRWRARILYATETGITPSANPPHGPWRRIFGQGTEADIRIGENTGIRFETDTNELKASTGGMVNFTLNAGTNNANRGYLILGGVTGTSPGSPLPGGQVTLPLNWDLFTNLVASLVNTPVFENFMGTLDGKGSGIAKFNTLGPFTSGGLTKVYFAFFLAPPYDFVSNPVMINITP